MFSYDFAAGEKRAVFTLEPTATATPPDAPCVYARVVPERFDDMAWENDRIAHRMYGFALNSPAAAAVGERLRGSGIDVWGKRVTYPIVDRWYAKGHDQFHKDGEGEGLDLYSIGGSRGAGGTGIWDGTKLWTSDNFVERAGAVEWPASRGVQAHLHALGCRCAAARCEETKQFTVDCGQQLRRGGEHLRFRRPTRPWSASASPSIRRWRAFRRRCSRGIPQGRWMSYWEENKDGGLGTAVILAGGAIPRDSRTRRPRRRRAMAITCCWSRRATACRCAISPAPAGTSSGQFADRASLGELREGLRGGGGQSADHHA